MHRVQCMYAWTHATSASRRGSSRRLAWSDQSDANFVARWLLHALCVWCAWDFGTLKFGLFLPTYIHDYDIGMTLVEFNWLFLTSNRRKKDRKWLRFDNKWQRWRLKWLMKWLRIAPGWLDVTRLDHNLTYDLSINVRLGLACYTIWRKLTRAGNELDHFLSDQGQKSYRSSNLCQFNWLWPVRDSQWLRADFFIFTEHHYI